MADLTNTDGPINSKIKIIISVVGVIVVLIGLTMIYTGMFPPMLMMSSTAILLIKLGPWVTGLGLAAALAAQLSFR